MIAVLHDIRSIYNVASIFRTADGVGVEKLYLSGYTPGPTDRFGRKRQKFQKGALGTEDSVEFEQVDDIRSLLTDLSDTFTILACEPVDAAIDYRAVEVASEKICLLFGNEPDGLPEDLLGTTDQIIKIPMQGEKSSLNVSVAFGIITSRLLTK